MVSRKDCTTAVDRLESDISSFRLSTCIGRYAENEVFWAVHYAKGMEIVGATFAAYYCGCEEW